MHVDVESTHSFQISLNICKQLRVRSTLEYSANCPDRRFDFAHNLGDFDPFTIFGVSYLISTLGINFPRGRLELLSSHFPEINIPDATMWLMSSGSSSHAGMKMQSWGLLTQSSASKPTQSRRSAAFTELSPCWNLLSPASCVIGESGQRIALKTTSKNKIASKQLGQRNSGFSTCAGDLRDRQAFSFPRSLPRIGVVRRNLVMTAVGEFMQDHHAWVARCPFFWFSDQEIII